MNINFVNEYITKEEGGTSRLTNIVPITTIIVIMVNEKKS